MSANQITPQEQKQNLADLILEQRDKIANLQSELAAAKRKNEYWRALGLPNPGEGLIHGLNDEGFRLLGSKEDVEHFKSEYERAAGRWISVEDSLPELKARVLVYDHDGFGVLSARLGPAGWYLEGELDSNANVTHWMPLPEPPNAIN